MLATTLWPAPGHCGKGAGLRALWSPALDPYRRAVRIGNIAPMSDRDAPAGHSAGWLRGLIWAGVLLAPIAAGVVLLGGSGAVRFAVVLLAVSVVLVGASVLIRFDPVLHRMDVEDRVAEEVARLRRELRAELARDARGRQAAPSEGRDDVRPGPADSTFFRGQPMVPRDDPFSPDRPTAMPTGPADPIHGAQRIAPTAEAHRIAPAPDAQRVGPGPGAQ